MQGSMHTSNVYRGKKNPTLPFADMHIVRLDEKIVNISSFFEIRKYFTL
jgi:hypothetical protein